MLDGFRDFSINAVRLGSVDPSVTPFLLENPDDWIVDDSNMSVTPRAKTTERINISIARLLDQMRSSRKFGVLDGWRNELYAVYHPEIKGLSIERSASPLFGVNTYGVHMTAYTYIRSQLRIWVSRRARTKQTYANWLDNSAAGGLCVGEKPFECMVREANEEASLPEQLVRSKTRSCGTVSYIHVRDEAAGGESGLLQPECQYVYDLELDSPVILRPNDAEVGQFYLWSVQEVQQALAEGEFKPNCALVLLDFFVRHGIITPENEPKYTEIVTRMHRRLPFPGPECE